MGRASQISVGSNVTNHHISSYNGKLVVMDYVKDPKMEFHIAAMRILDNGFEGHVITPKGEVFQILKSKRAAIKVHGQEAQDFLTSHGIKVV